jgi:hypothetical protein
MRRRAWAAAAVAAMLGRGAVACNDSGGTECDCQDPTVRIEVPSDRAADALGVTFSGRGCATASAQCSQPVAGGCAEYTFEATGIGDCTIELQFSSTPADFQEQVSFAGVSCCSGFYIDPPSAAPIQVPSLDDDAGATG